MTFVRSTYRYKRPPRRKQPVAFEVPAMVKAADPSNARKPVLPESAPIPAPPAPAAIVTARPPGKRYVAVPDMMPEEHQRRGDAAAALWREVVRRVRKEP